MNDTAERSAVKSLTRGPEIQELPAAHPEGLALSDRGGHARVAKEVGR